MSGWGPTVPMPSPGPGPPLRQPQPPPVSHLNDINATKKTAPETESGDSVVSSTQDLERPFSSTAHPRFNITGDMTKQYLDEMPKKHQDHFGTFITLMNDIQDSGDLEQILMGEGTFQPEIKTEVPNPMDIELASLQCQEGGDAGLTYHMYSQSQQYRSQNGCEDSLFRYSPGCTEGKCPSSGSSGCQQYTSLALKIDTCLDQSESQTLSDGREYSPSSNSGMRGLSGPSYSPSTTNSQMSMKPYSPTSPSSTPTRERTKDEKYWERRRKNNLAAKKSRDARRVRENQLRLRVLCLENANRVLRGQLDKSQDEVKLLRDRLTKYEDVHLSSNTAYLDSNQHQQQQVACSSVSQQQQQQAGNSIPVTSCIRGSQQHHEVHYSSAEHGQETMGKEVYCRLNGDDSYLVQQQQQQHPGDPHYAEYQHHHHQPGPHQLPQ